MTKGFTLDDLPSNTGGRLRQPADTVDLHVYGPKLELVRIVEPIVMYGNHTVVARKKDKSMTRFSTPCLRWDKNKMKQDTTRECPWCLHAEKYPSTDPNNKIVGFSTTAFANGFVRAKMKSPPARQRPTAAEMQTKRKEKDSDTPTIWEVFRLTTSIINQMKAAKEVNVVELDDGSSEAYRVTHPQYGIDLRISYDKTKSPAQQYSVMAKEGQTPIGKVELSYLRWALDDLSEVPDLTEARRDYMSWADRNGHPNVYAKAARRNADIDAEEGDAYGEEGDDAGDGFDEPAPAPRRAPAGKPAAARRQPAADTDFDALDGDEGAEDGDDFGDDPAPAPAPRRAPAQAQRRAPAPRRAPPADDDFGDEGADDFGDEGEDDFGDEPAPAPAPRRAPAGKSAAPARRAPPPPDDEDPFQDDVDPDGFGDDEEPAPAPAPRRAVAAKAGAARPAPRRAPPPADADDEFAEL